MSQAIARAVAGLDDYGLEDDTIFTLDRIQYAIDIAPTLSTSICCPYYVPLFNRKRSVSRIYEFRGVNL